MVGSARPFAPDVLAQTKKPGGWPGLLPLNQTLEPLPVLFVRSATESSQVQFVQRLVDQIAYDGGDIAEIDFLIVIGRDLHACQYRQCFVQASRLTQK